MSLVHAYAVPSAKEPLVPFTVERREVGPDDVRIDIKACGVCHSDIHQGREEWGEAIFPMVPGHEIVGVVEAVGSNVTKYAIGDHVGVGCFIDSCRVCEYCTSGEDHFCQDNFCLTYNSTEKDNTTPTYGGYSTHIVVDQNYVLRVPDSLPFEGAAPLLCAGITLYSPLRKWGVVPGTRVGIVGLGGLGHMGVKLAVAMGADVTVLSHSPSKEQDAYALGAHHFINTTDPNVFKDHRRSLDLIINTVSVDLDIPAYLSLLDLDGSLVLVGVPENPLVIPEGALMGMRRRVSASKIGSIAETQEMLDFCGEHGITSDVEVISADYINEAWDRVVSSDVRYRFVIDTSTFG